MATEALVISANSTPQQWVPTGTTNHMTNLLGVGDGRYNTCAEAGRDERFLMSNPVGSIGEVTAIRFDGSYLSANKGTASTMTLIFRVYVGGVLRGQTVESFNTNLSPFTKNVSVAVSLDAAEIDDVQVSILSSGTGWTLFAANIVLDALSFTITYTPPVGDSLPIDVEGVVAAREVSGAQAVGTVGGVVSMGMSGVMTSGEVSGLMTDDT